MDAIFSLAYNISEVNPQKYGFTPIKTEKNQPISKIKMQLP